MALNYLIVIRANTLEEITEEALHFAYLFLSRSLQRHHQDGDGEYEEFALSVLALLRQYRHLYTTPPEPPDPD
jgi:hypothetical protein